MPRHPEWHRTDRVGWLRAAVLGANDGIVSTASLLMGVAAAKMGAGAILATGVAGLVAGAMSMAAGEYVSVFSQADTERADIEKERLELQADPVAEHRELAGIYVGRGLEPALAQQVAEQLMRRDALGTHARDELGIHPALAARPMQAALSSAGSFAAGAAIPLAVVAVTPLQHVVVVLAVASTITLAGLGALAAYAGGAPIFKGMLRVTAWGVFAMAVTSIVGSMFGVSV